MSEAWVRNETNHDVSKEASNSFFELGKTWFPLLSQAKQREGIERQTPNLVHLRRKIIEKKVPRISMDIAYVNKDNGEEILLEDVEKIPRSEYPPSMYLKKYEIASVKVFFIILNL